MQAGTKTKLLVIESVGAEHQGIYTCTAMNIARRVQYSARLNINGRAYDHVWHDKNISLFFLILSFTIYLLRLCN